MESFIGWIGGKRALRKTILGRFPQDYGRYIEVFGGAGWVLFGREPQPRQMEVFNDFDGDLINLYRCIKYHCNALIEELDGLCHSRELFLDFKSQLQARGLTDIQRAARYFCLIRFSFGCGRKNFRTAGIHFARMCDALHAIQGRLSKTIIERLDFAQLIRTYDRPDALFYLDPPYVGTEHYYDGGFAAEDHVRLADTLKQIRGKFVLSYNDSPTVRELYTGHRMEPVIRKNMLAGTSNSTPYQELLIYNY